MEIKRFETEVAGKKLVVETGQYANQANGSCTVQYGDTVVLATAVMASTVREGINFFPLMVDYEEKLYAAGKIKGSRFVKREGRPTDEAVLTARMVDRGIRPLFDKKIRNDVQVVVTVLSVDQENDPDIVSIIGASIALHISDIPWNGPVAGVRVCYDKEFKFNCSYEERENAVADITLTGNKNKISMIETSAKEADFEIIEKGIKQGKQVLGKVADFIEDIRKQVGKEKMQLPEIEIENLSKKDIEKYQTEAKKYIEENLENKIYDAKLSKAERKQKLSELKDEIIEKFVADGVEEDDCRAILKDYDDLVEKIVSKIIIEKQKRVDDRKIDEIRPLEIKTSLLPRLHGTGLFSRGETQVLSVVTLGAPGDELVLDTMEESGKRRYMHHYNFPPFSVGEARPLRGPGRRDIGHGALAEKALVPVLPNQDDFSYTIRVVSEVFGSNGSSSMASTCGSTLALMDAGVPIKNPVAGIAIGMASDEQGNFKILTDIRDLEDGPGGMDFKVTASKDGITAIQMDTKTDGLTDEVISQAMSSAKKAIGKLLEQITQIIPQPRQELSPYAPRIINMMIDPEKIREVIGTGGKVINEIIEETGVQIDIEDSGLVMITSTDQEMGQKAQNIIKEIIQGPEIGKVYTGKVIRLMDFGAMVQISKFHEGMVHVSRISENHVNKPSDVLKVGQEVKVKLFEIDDQGRLNLTMLLDSKPRPRGNGDRRDRRDRRDSRSPKRGFFKRNSK